MFRKNKLKVVLYSVLAVLGLGAVGSLTYKIVKDNQPIEFIDEIEFKEVECDSGPYLIETFSDAYLDFNGSSLKDELVDIIDNNNFRLWQKGFDACDSLFIYSTLYDSNGNSFIIEYNFDYETHDFDSSEIYYSNDGKSFDSKLYLPSDNFKISFENDVYLSHSYENDDLNDYYKLDINPFTKKRLAEGLFTYFCKYSYLDNFDKNLSFSNFSLEIDDFYDGVEYTYDSILYDTYYVCDFDLEIKENSTILFGFAGQEELISFNGKTTNVSGSSDFNHVSDASISSGSFYVYSIDLKPGTYSFHFDALAFITFDE